MGENVLALARKLRARSRTRLDIKARSEVSFSLVGRIPCVSVHACSSQNEPEQKSVVNDARDSENSRGNNYRDKNTVKFDEVKKFCHNGGFLVNNPRIHLPIIP